MTTPAMHLQPMQSSCKLSSGGPGPGTLPAPPDTVWEADPGSPVFSPWAPSPPTGPPWSVNFNPAGPSSTVLLMGT